MHLPFLVGETRCRQHEFLQQRPVYVNSLLARVWEIEDNSVKSLGRLERQMQFGGVDAVPHIHTPAREVLDRRRRLMFV
jgi:hypothetical protein